MWIRGQLFVEVRKIVVSPSRKAVIVSRDNKCKPGVDCSQGYQCPPGMGFVHPVDSVDSSCGCSQLETHERRRVPGKGTDE